jgi:hypothetical protein
MSGGGKGGSETSTQSLPPWLDAAAQRNVARAEDISRIGYIPKYGPDVAAFQPQQLAAFNNTNDLAFNFGMQGAPVNTPDSMDYGGGIQGYSSGPAFDQTVDQLAENRPGQAAAYDAQFIDPYATGTGGAAGADGADGASYVLDPRYDRSIDQGPGRIWYDGQWQNEGK